MGMLSLYQRAMQHNSKFGLFFNYFFNYKVLGSQKANSSSTSNIEVSELGLASG